MVELASSVDGLFSKIAKKAIEVGIIVPSKLRAGLEAAGFTVTYHVGPEDDAKEGDHTIGAWVLVKFRDAITARAYSYDKSDALLQAVYAEMKVEADATIC